MRSPVHKLFQDYATIHEDVAFWVLLYVTLLASPLGWLVAASVVGPVVDPVAQAIDPVAQAIDPVAPKAGRVAPEVGQVAPEVGQVAPEVASANAEVEAVASLIGVAAVVARSVTEWHVSRCRRGASGLHTIGGRTDLLRTHQEC